LGVQVFSNNGQTTLRSLDFWYLTSIWFKYQLVRENGEKWRRFDLKDYEPAGPAKIQIGPLCTRSRA
jgi:hypothetical protein